MIVNLAVEKDLEMKARLRERVRYTSHNILLTISSSYGNCYIDGFHSRDLQSCGTQMTKAMTAMLVHVTKEVH